MLHSIKRKVEPRLNITTKITIDQTKQFNKHVIIWMPLDKVELALQKKGGTCSAIKVLRYCMKSKSEYLKCIYYSKKNYSEDTGQEASKTRVRSPSIRRPRTNPCRRYSAVAVTRGTSTTRRGLNPRAHAGRPHLLAPVAFASSPP